LHTDNDELTSRRKGLRPPLWLAEGNPAISARSKNGVPLTWKQLSRNKKTITLSSRLMAAQPIMGPFDLMDVIAAVVIGGTSLLGGEGSIIGTVIGTFIIASMRKGLNLLGISPDWQLIAVGTIIVLAVLADYVGRKRVL
jgi:Branched-chain amino acid transport system / permease component